MLPEGDPEAGRTAFMSLGCTSCHTVAWDRDLPAPTSPTKAPELGLDSAHPGPGGLATSIIAPSHEVPEEYRVEPSGKVSPMPNYTSTMTIRQLADIVAYLQRQGLKTQTQYGQS
jgi:mono/diheme cytochrome c family protein